MDIKSSRKNKTRGILISLVLLMALSAGMMVFYPAADRWRNRFAEQKAKEAEEDRPEEKTLMWEAVDAVTTEPLLRFNYGLYWKLCQREESRRLTPSEVFLPDYLQTDINTTEIPNEEIRSQFDGIMEEWFDSEGNQIQEGLGGFYSAALTGKDIKDTNMFASVEQSVKEDAEKDLLIRFSYDAGGGLTVPELTGYLLEDDVIKGLKDKLVGLEFDRKLFEQSFDGYWDYWETGYPEIKTPQSFEVTYRIPYENLKSYADSLYHGYETSGWNTEDFLLGGYWIVLAGALLLLVLSACLLPFLKSSGVRECIFSRIPLELSALGIICGFSLLFSSDFLMSVSRTASREVFEEFSTSVPEAIQAIGVYGANFIGWLGIFFLLYQFVLTIHSWFSRGFLPFLKKQTITGRMIGWAKNRMRRFLDSLHKVDLEKGTDKTIFKIVLFNFVILAILSCFWFFGIFLLIIYSVILFFFIKKYADEAKKKYGILLKATNTMAEGNLNIEIEEELGVFQPLGRELSKVRQGFQKAVEEETKSERMKTELITNVSHDLKTPLTAIITYVNLLKEDTATEEEKRSYIDTLDKKSQRLKTLIEDLFEVSRANSKNVTLHPVEVDLGDLIKQAALESEDRIRECGVEFRYQLPEEKIILKLDSEKTYRIFENLLVNITKYALPGSRAYISLKKYDGYAVAVFKNVSAQELNFDSTEITERFARGDKSRSTEGSGLGLAIVKSFTQLQDGSFEVVTDGDLFKAIVTLPM